MSKKLMPTEHADQAALFTWMALQHRYPELALAYAIPNAGKRNPVEGRRKKQEGLKTGVPDICIPVARGGFHGMYLELKVGSNKPTNEQDWWLRELRRQGYYAICCWGWEAASQAILAYAGRD